MQPTGRYHPLGGQSSVSDTLTRPPRALLSGRMARRAPMRSSPFSPALVAYCLVPLAGESGNELAVPPGRDNHGDRYAESEAEYPRSGRVAGPKRPAPNRG